MEHSWSQQTSYPVLDTNFPQQQDFLSEYKSMNMSPQTSRMMSPQSHPNMSHSNPNMTQSLVPIQQQPSQSSISATLDSETLQTISKGMTKMMSMLDRMEQRLQKVEQATSQILKNQQEVFQVPFMSQSEIDQARNAAEILERDSSVAKQLQAAYNKEIEVRKNFVSVSQQMVDCPICGVRVSGGEIEMHVDQCLEMFSSDPKKEVQVQEAKKKMDQGFFSRFIKTAKTKETTTTKVTTTSTSSGKSEATAPLLGDRDNGMMMPGYYPPQFAYPQAFGNHPQGGQQPMMMPMYMYPSYPNTHMTTQLQE